MVLVSVVIGQVCPVNKLKGDYTKVTVPWRRGYSKWEIECKCVTCVF